MNTHQHSQPMVKFVTKNTHSRSECEGSLVFTAICLRASGGRVSNSTCCVVIRIYYTRICTHPCSRIWVRKCTYLRIHTLVCANAGAWGASTHLPAYTHPDATNVMSGRQLSDSAAEHSAVSCYLWVSGSAATKLYDLARVHIRFLASLAVRVVRVARTGA